MDWVISNIKNLADGKKPVESVKEKPITLRHFLEGRPIPQCSAGTVDRIKIDGLAGQWNTGGPVTIRRKGNDAPVAIAQPGIWTVLEVYWRLLKKQGRCNKVDVDHTIALPPGGRHKHNWPILRALVKDFRRATQYRTCLPESWVQEYQDDFTVLLDIFQQHLSDKPENWELEYMFVPMWDMNDPCDGNHAIFILEQMACLLIEGDNVCEEFDMPAEAVEHFGDEAIRHAWARIVDDLVAGKLSRFPPLWRKSLRFLKNHYLMNISAYDIESQAMTIRTPEDILRYFSAYRLYCRMQIVTGELYNAFNGDSAPRWIELFGAFIPKS